MKLGGVVIAAVWLFRLLDRRTRMRFIFADHPLVAWSAIALVAFAAASMLWATESGAAFSSGSTCRTVTCWGTSREPAR